MHSNLIDKFFSIKNYSVQLLNEHSDLKDYFNDKSRVAFEKKVLTRDLDMQNSFKSVIFDGTFDNRNYFFRMMLFQKALGLKSAAKFGLVGKFRRHITKRTLKNFGIDEIINVNGYELDKKSVIYSETICKELRCSQDILKSKLPYDFPAHRLYDSILKRQKLHSVDINDPKLSLTISETHGAIFLAESLINEINPDLMVLSHMITPLGAALSWVGLKNKINSVIPFGNYGVPRFYRVACENDFLQPMEKLDQNLLRKFSPVQTNALEKVGQKYSLST